MNNSEALEKLSKLKGTAVKTINRCMQDGSAKWSDRLTAAKEVLDRTGVKTVDVIGKDEISDRLKLALSGIVVSFLGEGYIEELKIAEKIEGLLEDTSKDEGVYEGDINVRSIEEKRKYS